VQLLAGLMLNRIRIVLKPLDMPLQEVVFPLEATHLLLKALRVLSLLLVRGEPVLAKDDVVPHRHREQSSSSRSDLPPAHVTSLEKAHHRTLLLFVRVRVARTSHIRLSTNFTPHTVKWKTLFCGGTYLVHTRFIGPRPISTNSLWANRISCTKSMHLVILLKAVMQILFAISILCFFGLAITAIAIARHLRKPPTHPQHDFATFASAEDQNSRVPQSLPRQTVTDIQAKKSSYRPSDRLAVGRGTQEHQSPSLKPF
jgi:hypothetical protein